MVFYVSLPRPIRYTTAHKSEHIKRKADEKKHNAEVLAASDGGSGMLSSEITSSQVKESVAVPESAESAESAESESQILILVG